MRTPFHACLCFLSAVFILCSAGDLRAEDAGSRGEAVKALNEGTESYKAGEYNQALESFTKARDLLPGDPDVLYYLGMTYLKLTETERAAEYFQMALDKDPEHTDARFQLGSCQVIMKDFASALPNLDAVRDKDPGRLNLGYMLGLAYYETGQYDKALTAFEGANVKDKTIAGLNLYYLGLTKMRLGMVDEAGSSYKELLNVDPTSPLAPSSERLMDVLAASAQARRKYHVQLTTKYQYDTNAVLAPTAQILNLQDMDRKTGVEFIFLRGDYTLMQKKDDAVTASYSFLQTVNNNVDDLDFQDHIFSLSGLHKGIALGKPCYLRGTYTYDYALLGYRSYLHRHTLRPSFTLIEGPKYLTLLQYSLQFKDFNDDPDIHQENRDAVNNEVGLVQYARYSGDKHYIYGGYFMDTENAAGSNWSYDGSKFMAGAQATLPAGFRANLDYSYKYSRFNRENTLFRKEREDRNHIVSATVSKEVLKNLFLSIEFLYNRSDSTVLLYDFEKEVYSIGAVWKF